MRYLMFIPALSITVDVGRIISSAQTRGSLKFTDLYTVRIIGECYRRASATFPVIKQIALTLATHIINPKRRNIDAPDEDAFLGPNPDNAGNLRIFHIPGRGEPGYNEDGIYQIPPGFYVPKYY